jgi:hypothetical protein
MYNQNHISADAIPKTKGTIVNPPISAFQKISAAADIDIVIAIKKMNILRHQCRQHRKQI